MTRRSGDIFGTYHLLEEIGRGGAGDVYRARHIHPAYAEKAFAIKRLHPKVALDADVVARFRREAYVLSMLEHPNIVKTVEAGSEGGELFIAMEYVNGPDLGALIDHPAMQRFPIPMAVYITTEILRGLAYGHTLRDSGNKPMSIVHRDIKPSNVLVSYQGQVKITDFGVATLVGADPMDPEGMVMGTMGYIAPEALTGKSFDQRADLFAVGSILFELLCGVNPFQAETPSRAIKKNVRAQVPRPTKLNAEIPPALEQVILRAMEKDPSRRYGDATEMLAALVPFTPQWAGMELALGAMVRKVFVEDYARLQQERESESAIIRGQRLIALGGSPQLVQELAGHGLAAEACMQQQELAGAIARDPPPQVLLVNLSEPSLDAAALTETVSRAPRVLPIIALANGFSLNVVRIAEALGAVDLLYHPVHPLRLLTSVREALARGRYSPNLGSPGEQSMGLRVRIVSSDPALAARLSGRLAEWGYDVDVSPNGNEAVELTTSASPHGVVYDYAADPDPDPNFANRLRACPGMGLVPVVYLTADGRAPAQLPERCAVRARTDNDVSVVSTLNHLHMSAHLGRTFTRYLTVLEAELRYGGRAFAAHSIDLSRGGVLLQSPQMPAIGTAVRVVLRLHGREVEMPGQVVRSQLPDDHSPDSRSRIGVSFKPASPRNEEPLITYLTALEHYR